MPSMYSPHNWLELWEMFTWFLESSK